jgi:ureidoacrylate peracid hydrolase
MKRKAPLATRNERIQNPSVQKHLYIFFGRTNCMMLDDISIGNTALIVVDIQNAYCSKNGSMALQGFDISPIEGMLARLARFIKSIEKTGMKIIYTRQVEGDEMPSNLKKLFVENKMIQICGKGSVDTEFTRVRPRKQDMIVEKHSWDAFSNPELDRFLKQGSIHNLIIAGATSDVCVNDTVISAFSKGYNVIVPQDLVATFNMPWKQQLHRLLLTKSWKTYRARVLDSEIMAKRLKF